MTGPDADLAAVAVIFDVINGADPDALRDVLTEDFSVGADAMGVERAIQTVRMYRAAMPEAVSVVDRIIAVEGGVVATWTTVTGTACLRLRAHLLLRDARIYAHRVQSVTRVW